MLPPPTNVQLSVTPDGSAMLTWDIPGDPVRPDISHEMYVATEIWCSPTPERTTARSMGWFRQPLFDLNIHRTFRHVQRGAGVWHYWLSVIAHTAEQSPSVYVSG
jgi:hypothetical protein